MKIRHCKISPIVGIGYWKDKYVESRTGIEGETHNFILPFLRIQWGWIARFDPDVSSTITAILNNHTPN